MKFNDVKLPVLWTVMVP